MILSQARTLENLGNLQNQPGPTAENLGNLQNQPGPTAENLGNLQNQPGSAAENLGNLQNQPGSAALGIGLGCVAIINKIMKRVFPTSTGFRCLATGFLGTGAFTAVGLPVGTAILASGVCVAALSLNSQ